MPRFRKFFPHTNHTSHRPSRITHAPTHLRSSRVQPVLVRIRECCAVSAPSVTLTSQQPANIGFSQQGNRQMSLFSSSAGNNPTPGTHIQHKNPLASRAGQFTEGLLIRGRDASGSGDERLPSRRLATENWGGIAICRCCQQWSLVPP